MNIKEYVNNPMGVGSNAIPNRQVIVADYKQQWREVIQDNKKIEHKVYKRGGDYFVHIIVPSHSKRGNSYDIVFKFRDDPVYYRESTVLNYEIEMFCNAPSFTYTYAYAFNNQGLLVSELKDKFEDIVIRDDPKMRNPYKIISYEKYLFFGAMYLMEDSQLTSKEHLDKVAIKFDLDKFKSTIRSDAKVTAEIKKYKNKLKEEKTKKEIESKSRVNNKNKTEKKQSKSTVNVIKPKTKKSKTVNKLSKKVNTIK